MFSRKQKKWSFSNSAVSFHNNKIMQQVQRSVLVKKQFQQVVQSSASIVFAHKKFTIVEISKCVSSHIFFQKFNISDGVKNLKLKLKILSCSLIFFSEFYRVSFQQVHSKCFDSRSNCDGFYRKQKIKHFQQIKNNLNSRVSCVGRNVFRKYSYHVVSVKMCRQEPTI